MITPSERDTLNKEKDIEALTWLIDLSAMNSPILEDAEVSFGDGDHFNFNEEVSIKTTRFANEDNNKP